MINRRILVIDDEEDIHEAYRFILAPSDSPSAAIEARARALETELFGPEQTLEPSPAEHYELFHASQGREGYELVSEARARELPVALAFIDVRMPPGWDGLETARMIRKIDPEIELVMVTAYSDRDRAEIVRRVGCPERLLYIKKPFDPDEIRQLALALTRKWELERQSERQRENLTSLLTSVRRLKTLSVSSAKEVLAAILEEVLSFVSADQGVIARDEGGGIRIEITTTGLIPEKLAQVLTQWRQAAPDPWAPVRRDDLLILPLEDIRGHLFVLICDARNPLPDEKVELLKLLLETAAEVLSNIRKQQYYLKNERIAAIGQVSAGIIHEMANPLTGIVGAATLLQRHLERVWELVDCYEHLLTQAPEPIGAKMLDLRDRYAPGILRRKMADQHAVILTASGRVQDLMRGIRGVSRDSDRHEPRLGDVAEALETTLILALGASKSGVAVHRAVERPLLAWCDLGGLQQVFLNLILNAVQAMEGRGELFITARRDGDRILVTIRDTGPGIPDQLREHIFDPFFTTKEDGTGLGLSIVRGIIQKHGGRLLVETGPGGGASFIMEFPVRLETVDDRSVEPDTPARECSPS